MLVLSNVSKLYDGASDSKSSVRAKVDVFVDGGTIRDVKPHDPKLALGDGQAKVDCSKLFVTPGLIDCHGHVTILGLANRDMDVMNSGASLVYVEKILHATLVDGGVTTMRDVGGATHLMKRLVDEGVLIGPRLKIAICMLSTTGGHADFRGPDRCHAELSRLFPEVPGRPSSIVDGPWECRKRVREIAACGADLVKICASPGVASPSDNLESRDFTAEEIAAICDEAQGRGLRVAAHAHSRSGIELAIENGVYDLQHISFLDDRLAELAHKKDCAVTPTSWVIGELPHAEGLSEFVMGKVRQVNETHRAAVQSAAKSGLKILMGTDPVLPGMHGSNYMEVVALARDGLPPLKAWHGATGLAAKTIGQSDAGTIAAGQRADLLLHDVDVIEKPELLAQKSILEVIKDGVGYRGAFPQIPQRTFKSTVADALARDRSN